ncbi:glycosyltransferase family 2 protein [Denitromonas iodatirespirans]|uniref:Glycosyltransferase family 2 protein n=1 Tax=Denitromonas iodatirespirans TaxID=2795389 RepID=A0A944HC42_DENI1|nr:glycosyltransferase family 2 protein [Denitromonas iodatirespirans]MBT0962317.1 glycosyltransferase family 2 protein [Denitromonas iodatirespirans]
MTSPRLSVCIPAYNRAGQLPPLLDSIFRQNFDDLEVVIAEDGSPERDAIRQVAETYADRYPGRLHYVENPKNLGYDGNLRRLIELAHGDFVVFMGNDDLMAPEAAARIASAATRHPNIGVVLRSYASFHDDPQHVEQVFRYFDGERFFPAGIDTIVTFFRRSVFISGMVVNREAALACSTPEFDGSLLYQQHLVGHILAKHNGVYVPDILSFHRLGGTPDFGNSEVERGRFVPREQTPESSVHFMRGMLTIARSLETKLGLPLYVPILKDIGNYSYPILSIQADRSASVFLRYLLALARLGFWRVPLFYGYALGLLSLGRRRCDTVIAKIKRKLGRAPRLGAVYEGNKEGRY